jgi:eukaryotic-like serine/threonine-protein kinase
MGVVYEAEQQHPKRLVALKVIRGGRFVHDEHVKLFQREAQALARLRHPGIAAIYEAGRTEDGQHFFAMELVRGNTSDVGRRPRLVIPPIRMTG